MSKRKEWLTCRDVLWYLVFWGFAIDYILRLNLNLTIVVMVLPRPKPPTSALCGNVTVFSKANETQETSPDQEVILNDDLFDWDEYQQSLALGAYYWLHWLSQLPGGLLTRRYGSKVVFGLGNVLPALLGFLIPVLTRYHFYALIFIRILQGLIAGVLWPSIHDMTAKWIPPNERSKFVSSYLGSSIGAAITYPLCATVSHAFGWGGSFYVTSLLGLIWYAFWWFLAYDTPQQHPRISEEEKKYILDNTRQSVDEKQLSIPWKSILLSRPVWITIVTQWGAGWGFLTLMTQAPTYFNSIHGWNLNATGILSGTPHVIRMIFSYYYSIWSDWLIRTDKMSVTNVRKLATFVCVGMQGIFILILGYSGCHPILAAAMMTAGTATSGAISASTLATFVDLSPNYASILLGLCGLITIWVGFISPAIVGILTNNNQTIEQWHIVFVIAAINSIAGCIIYVLFGTSKEQAWNKHEQLTQQNEEEMHRLPLK